MIDLLNRDIDRYLNRLHRIEDPVPAEMEQLAAERNFPIVGPQVGRLLVLLTRLRQAKRILELGSGFGYSAYWFARALGSDGELILTEYRAKNLEQARTFLQRGGFSCRLDFHAGDALQLLDQIRGSFDIILNDIDKRDYPRAFDRASVRLNPGGLLITDNVLWSGRVLDPQPDDQDTQGVLDYTDRCFRHPDFFSVILPVRDGVAVSLKL